MSDRNLPDGKMCRNCFHWHRCNASKWTWWGSTVCVLARNRFVDAAAVPQTIFRNVEAKPSDTPRTDDDQRCLVCNGIGGHLEGCQGTSAYDELERENAKLRDQLEFDREGRWGLAAEVGRLRKVLVGILETARASHVICSALDDIKTQCSEALKGGRSE